MKSFNPIHLLPSVIVALGIIAASVVMRFVPDLPWFAAPIVLAIAIVIACVVDTHLHDDIPATNIVVRVFVAAILLVCVLLFANDMTRLNQMLPILGAVAWVSLLQRQPVRKTRD